MLLLFAMKLAQRLAVVLLSLGLVGLCEAQVLLDKPIILEGTSDPARQVSGLRDATSEPEALNARSLQSGQYHYAEVLGGASWEASATPHVGALQTGLRLLLRVQNGTNGPATLNVDGLGAFNVVKDGDLPLQADDVAAGETISLVFDGAVFQLISARRIDKRPCPSGTVAVGAGATYCIEIQEHDTTDYPTAAVTCGGLNMQLCSWGQWYVACTMATELGLQNMLGNWEWTNSPANSDAQARVVGESTCTQAGATTGWNATPRYFRCCFRR